MNALSKIDMREVTRLTKAGKLAEAMALLRGGIGAGVKQDGADFGTGPAGPGDVIDMVAPLGARKAWTTPIDLNTRIGKAAGAFHAFGSVLNRNGVSQEDSSQDRQAPATPSENGRFIERSFSNQAGGRTYKVFVPSGFSGQKLPLVVMLHGCTQDPDEFAAGTRMNELAEEQTFLVAYPRQSQTANMQKCWNWFNADNQRREGGETSIIAGITKQVIDEFNADPTRVYAAGLSAGGAAAAIMAQTYPDVYAAIGVHSGLACGAAKDMMSAFAAMSGRTVMKHSLHGPAVPTIIFHGDADRTVNFKNGDQIAMQARSDRPLSKIENRGEEGGMAYSRTIQRNSAGVDFIEHWVLHGAGHAWSGGSASGSFTDKHGPDASREMLRFFLRHRNANLD
jgi:poly(hydroxyalkanoate) depolymerase family esterase